MSNYFVCLGDHLNQRLKYALDQYGVAIIPDVINQQECDTMLSNMWDYFEHISQNWPTPIKRNDVSSYDGMYNMQPQHSMLFQHYSIGHCQASWDLRQNIKIVSIFADLWDCKKEELLVSFDGLSFNMPPEDTKRGWFRGNTWFHTDQSYTRNGFECVQSWVTALDVEEGDATLAVYEGSHKYHKEFAETYSIVDKSDWYKLKGDQHKFYKDRGCKEVRVACPKGSMVFWDSRIIHCGVEAIKNRKNPKLRAVIYLCYMPRSLATDRDIEKKKKALIELRTTSHWAIKTKMFSKKPWGRGRSIPDVTPIGPPILTELGRVLAGY
jgi:hypothetical protein